MTARATACVLLVAFSAAGAQSPKELRLEVGAARIEQFGRDARDGVLLGGLWRSAGPRLSTLASGAFTWAGDSATAAQAFGALAWRPDVDSPWHSEGGVSGAAFGVLGLGRGGNVNSWLRERLSLSDGGLWIGGAAGHTDRDQLQSHSTSMDMGVSLRSSGFETSFSWARVRTSDWPLMEASGIFLSRDAAAHDLDDVTLSARYEHGPFSAAGSHIWRGGERATLAGQTAFYWTVSWAFTPRVSLTAGGGRQLSDPVNGTPDVRLASASLRIALLPLRWDGRRRAASAVARLLPRPDGGAILIIDVRSADSTGVEVAGSFSGWDPVPLRRTRTGWEAEIVLPRGQHRVAVRVGQGPWTAPSNLASVKDDFGGRAGVIVVP